MGFLYVNVKSAFALLLAKKLMSLIKSLVVKNNDDIISDLSKGVFYINNFFQVA